MNFCNELTYSYYNYPFGMMLPNTNVNPVTGVFVEEEEGYRYGYQGSEMDNEVKGENNSYTTYFRQLDPRIGRWLSIDPKAKDMPWQSVYCSMDNNPVWNNDIMGDVVKPKGRRKNKKKYKKQLNEEAEHVSFSYSKGELNFQYGTYQNGEDIRSYTYKDLSDFEKDMVDAIRSNKTQEVFVNPNKINAFISDDFTSVDVNETEMLTNDMEIDKVKSSIFRAHASALKLRTYEDKLTVQERQNMSPNLIFKESLTDNFGLEWPNSANGAKIATGRLGAEHHWVYFGTSNNSDVGGSSRAAGVKIIIYTGKGGTGGVVLKIMKTQEGAVFPADYKLPQ